MKYDRTDFTNPHTAGRLTGANQLLWYYADLEKQRCYNDNEVSGSESESAQISTASGFAAAAAAPPNERYMDAAAAAAAAAAHSVQANVSSVDGQAGIIQHDINHCLAWRRFAK